MALFISACDPTRPHKTVMHCIVLTSILVDQISLSPISFALTFAVSSIFFVVGSRKLVRVLSDLSGAEQSSDKEEK